MSTPPRHLPRFLPTLTEVVQPSESTPSAPPEMLDNEALTHQILQRLDGVIERQLKEEIDALMRALVTTQMQTLRSRLREEMELVVRQAVSDALQSQADLHKRKS